jgi:predicted tellurium resistance membrane protein TerC
MEWLANPDIWASFVTLAVLEIVLGIDNLVFIALLAGRLPPGQRARARSLGLALALGTRLALLWSIVWLVHLTQPIFALGGHDFSWRDLILIGGGGFLLYKGTREIHLRVDGVEEGERTDREAPTFTGTVAQIMLLDIVFSLDSVITAVGVADEIWVMVAAIVVAMVVMLAASGPLASFIERHTSVKMLALSFLLLIGMVLVADGFGFHVPRGYVYAAMGFSILVESLNLIAAQRRSARIARNRSSRPANAIAVTAGEDFRINPRQGGSNER